MMRRAKITSSEGFRCYPDGHTLKTYFLGDIVDGQVAKWAVSARRAAWMMDPRTDTQAGVALETKAKPKRGRPRKTKAE